MSETANLLLNPLTPTAWLTPEVAHIWSIQIYASIGSLAVSTECQYRNKLYQIQDALSRDSFGISSCTSPRIIKCSPNIESVYLQSCTAFQGDLGPFVLLLHLKKMAGFHAFCISSASPSYKVCIFEGLPEFYLTILH